MPWNRDYRDVYAHVILSVSIGRGRRFGLVFSADWTEFFIGIFIPKRKNKL